MEAASGGVRIRPYRPGDIDALFEAASESVEAVHPWLPWCHPAYTRAESEIWIRSRKIEWEAGREYSFAILDAGGRFLGGCGLNQINTLHRFANLGYWVRSSAVRRGVATSAVRQVARFAFRETELLRLEIVVSVDNPASQRVAEKAGALREGVLADRLFLHGTPHDALVYALVCSRDARALESDA
jgi:RimJ/RimL family protein N-acetyltransferase